MNGKNKRGPDFNKKGVAKTTPKRYKTKIEAKAVMVWFDRAWHQYG